MSPIPARMVAGMVADARNTPHMIHHMGVIASMRVLHRLRTRMSGSARRMRRRRRVPPLIRTGRMVVVSSSMRAAYEPVMDGPVENTPSLVPGSSVASK